MSHLLGHSTRSEFNTQKERESERETERAQEHKCVFGFCEAGFCSGHFSLSLLSGDLPPFGFGQFHLPFSLS